MLGEDWMLTNENKISFDAKDPYAQ